MEAVKQPTLREFLEKPCGEVLEDIPFSVFMGDLIREWALSMQPGHGQLPGSSGRAFAGWLDAVWENWTEEPEVPVQRILEGAVAEWCGGRSFR